MYLLNAHKQEAGVTLMEVLVTAVILGILAAIGVPNIVAIINRSKVQNGLDIVRTVLQDSQNQAVRVGKNCSVELRKSSAAQKYYDLIVARGDGTSATAHCLASIPAKYSLETAPKKGGGQWQFAIQEVKLPDGLRIATNIVPSKVVPAANKPPKSLHPSLEFSLKGHIANFDEVVDSKELPAIVIFPVNEPNEEFYSQANAPRKCIIAGSLLGLLRTGNYDRDASLSSAVDDESCKAGLDGRRSR